MVRPSKGWIKFRQIILERDGFACIQCKSKDRVEVDHKVPVALGGGLLDAENCRTLCYTCHKEKTQWDVRKIAMEKEAKRCKPSPPVLDIADTPEAKRRMKNRLYMKRNN